MPETIEELRADNKSSAWRWLRRGLKVGLAAVAVLAIAVGVGLLLLYRAATAPLPQYQALLAESDEAVDSGELDRQRQELESQLAALYSDAKSAERWQTVLTAEQINAWLATQLAVDFPQLGANGIRQPRVLLADGAATLACRTRVRGVEAVASIVFTPLVANGGLVGLEVQSVRVGSLGLPIASVVQASRKILRGGDALRSAGLRWSLDSGSPVLLLDFERLASTAEHRRTIDAIGIREGEVLVSGETTPQQAAPPEEAS